MARLTVLTTALLVATSPLCGGATGGQTRGVVQAAAGISHRSLYAQSARQILDREFKSKDLSYLLFDAQAGTLLASRWPEADQPIPLGSLVKPFTALAYAEHHAYRYPVYVCRGAASGCWQQRPHGKLNLVSAMAYSCNSYFREMTSHLTGDQVREISTQFGFDSPAPALTGPPLMGLGDEWPISPLRLAHAYLELADRREEPGVREILMGMEDSAKWGTGAGVGRALKHSHALVKTGTAVCRHAQRAPGDGFVIALAPAEQPELLLMIRVHGVSGATAAVTAGKMLARLEQ